MCVIVWSDGVKTEQEGDVIAIASGWRNFAAFAAAHQVKDIITHRNGVGIGDALAFLEGVRDVLRSAAIKINWSARVIKMCVRNGVFQAIIPAYVPAERGENNCHLPALIASICKNTYIS